MLQRIISNSMVYPSTSSFYTQIVISFFLGGEGQSSRNRRRRRALKINKHPRRATTEGLRKHQTSSRIGACKISPTNDTLIQPLITTYPSPNIVHPRFSWGEVPIKYFVFVLQKCRSRRQFSLFPKMHNFGLFPLNSAQQECLQPTRKYVNHFCQSLCKGCLQFLCGLPPHNNLKNTESFQEFHSKSICWDKRAARWTNSHKTTFP